MNEEVRSVDITKYHIEFKHCEICDYNLSNLCPINFAQDRKDCFSYNNKVIEWRLNKALTEGNAKYQQQLINSKIFGKKTRDEFKRKYNCHFRYRRWSQIEDNYLKQNYFTKTLKETAIALDRTLSGVHYRRVMLKRRGDL